MSNLDEMSLASKESDIKCLKAATDFVTSQSQFSFNRSEILGNEAVSRFVRTVIVCVLSECMNELSILRSVNLQSDLGTCPNKLLTYTSIEDRYMGQENHADYRINSTNSNFDKLAKDINMLHTILKVTCDEMRTFGNYKILEDVVKAANQMHKEEEQLLEDEANQERIIEDLKTNYEEERLESIRTIEETDANIQRLKFEVEDISFYGQLEVQYFDLWEKARLEQNMMKCREREHHFETIIKDTLQKIAIEKRCHEELEAYFEEINSDHLESIQYWMKLYDEDIEQRENDIIRLRTELEKITEERKIMAEKYETRQAEIDEWLEYKKQKEEKERQRLKQIKAATKIQAWWRGVMYRRKLGPYRKQKKQKNSGKKKGKKK